MHYPLDQETVYRPLPTPYKHLIEDIVEKEKGCCARIFDRRKINVLYLKDIPEENVLWRAEFISAFCEDAIAQVSPLESSLRLQEHRNKDCAIVAAWPPYLFGLLVAVVFVAAVMLTHMYREDFRVTYRGTHYVYPNETAGETRGHQEPNSFLTTNYWDVAMYVMEAFGLLILCLTVQYVKDRYESEPYVPPAIALNAHEEKRLISLEQACKTMEPDFKAPDALLSRPSALIGRFKMIMQKCQALSTLESTLNKETKKDKSVAMNAKTPFLKEGVYDAGAEELDAKRKQVAATTLQRQEMINLIQEVYARVKAKYFSPIGELVDPHEPGRVVRRELDVVVSRS